MTVGLGSVFSPISSLFGVANRLLKYPRLARALLGEHREIALSLVPNLAPGSLVHSVSTSAG